MDEPKKVPKLTIFHVQAVAAAALDTLALSLDYNLEEDAKQMLLDRAELIAEVHAWLLSPECPIRMMSAGEKENHD